MTKTKITPEGPALIPLGNLQPNPFQPRAAEDPAALIEIAANIHRNGLMQIPSARPVNGHYELVFGHTRKAAYELLAQTGIPEMNIPPDERFALMPIHVRQLDDRQMFEMAIAENVKRRDLNPMEQATAMRRYMDEFRASSREAGELFGVGGATVRGMVRLLKLPEATRRMVASGEITQGVARQLVNVARLDEEAAVKCANEIAAGRDADWMINSAFNGSKRIITMHQRWYNHEPLGGPGLWPLSLPPDEFPAENLPPLTIDDNYAGVKLQDRTEEFQQQLDVLANPPACVACPFYLAVNKQHYCGYAPCHKRKTAAWLQRDASALSESMGIGLYDPTIDGKQFHPLSSNSWGDEYKADQRRVDNKDADLRLQVHPGEFPLRWTQHAAIRVIAVGALAAQKKETAVTQKANNSHDEWGKKLELERIQEEASQKFCAKYAYPFFAEAFKGLDNLAVLAALADVNLQHDEMKALKRADKLNTLRVQLAERALWESIDATDGPVKVAQHLKGVATEWGVKLPPDFLKIAKKYQPVSTETPEAS